MKKTLAECNLHIKVVENSEESDKHCINVIDIFQGKYSLHIRTVENSEEIIKHCFRFIENYLGEYNLHIKYIETFLAKSIYHVTCMVWKDENNQ